MRRASAGPRWETPDPPGVAGTYGERVIRHAAKRGVKMGRWQVHTLRKFLRHDKHGDLLARIALLSTARQNGKSIIVRALFDWMLDEGRCLPAFTDWTTILAAAHDAKQARIIYKGVYHDLQDMGLPGSRLTEHFGITSGKLNLDTVTGQPGSSRGLSAGAIAWDEMLTQRDWDMWEALSPTQSAQRSPIMLLTSTAGHADSVILRAFYDRLVRQASGDEAPDPTFYGAWWESEDPDAGLDWDAIAQANPALGDGRLSRAAITTEHGLLPPDSWRRERLNHFVDVAAPGAFNPGVWAACRTATPLDGLEGPFALGVDVQPGWDRATITVAGMREDGRVGCEVYRDLRATEGNPVTSRRITAEIGAFPDPLSAVVYDSISGAAPEFRRHALDTGLPYVEVKRGDFVSACMDVTEMIQAARIAVDDPLLDAQIPHAARRMVGMDGAFCFSRGQSIGPIDAVIAMTFAIHSIASGGPKPNIF
jgi:hypothetical protein